MIKAIIFDFFGVLVTEGFKRFCDTYFSGDEAKHQQAIDLVTAHDRGMISQTEYVASLAELSGTDEDTVITHMAGNQPNDKLLEYIRMELKPKYKIGVLSNSGDDYLSKTLKPEDAAIFDDIVLSYRHRVVKPDRASFELAAERLGVKPTECIFIDDSKSHCEGAEKTGMRAVFYQNFNQLKRDLENNSVNNERLRQETIDTYNTSAAALAEYFRGIGSRVKSIDLAFELADNPKKPRVVEIGCGDGRDAKEIVRRSHYYLGFDISSELIKLARSHVPGAEFRVADATTFKFPSRLDVIFASASLLHLDKEEVRAVLENAHKALRAGGIFYISLKYKPEYTKEVKDDKFGRRLFYFYNEDIITELAGSGYEVAKTWREIHGHTEWFEIALRRI